MNPAIKQQWIDSLRSDEYYQGKEWLRHGTKEESSFCCLGVLCDLYLSDTRQQWDFPRDSNSFTWDSERECYVDIPEVSQFYADNEDETLPKSVAEWAGIPNDVYSDGLVKIERLGKTLAVINDEGTTFEEIAEIIEQNL